MSAPLFSPVWYRVAALKPRLRSHTRIHRHRYRSRIWYVLQDRLSGQFHRFTPEAYELIARMDGRHTLQDIWESACRKLGDMMPTQQDVIAMLSQLYQANAILTGRDTDIGELAVRGRRIRRQKWLQKIKSPLGLRFGLIDPERFLAATHRFVAPVFTRVGAIAWTLLVGFALMLAVTHWDQISKNAADHVLQVQNVLLMALVYPVVKVIHEFGHAYAVKRWGGEVHEMGVMFLVFYPVPYVDATAASAFRGKGQRAIVGAAGIAVEMVLASLSLFVWLTVEPGLVRAIAANVMLICGVSTLLFNGNPLLRFDAYYVLSDLLEIPNLAQRGNEQTGYLFKRFVLRVRGLTPPAWSRREAWWLAGYAITSYLYRLFVLLAISLLVTTRYPVIGGLIAVWSIYMTVIGPVLGFLRAPLTDARLRPRRQRIYSGGGIAALALLLILFVIPLPYSTSAEGLVWVQDKAILRAGENGFIDRIVAQPGTNVKKDAALVAIDNPETVGHVRQLTAELAQAQFSQQSSFDNPGQNLILTGNVTFLQDQLDTARQRERGLSLTAPLEGRFLLPGASDLPGRYVKRGERLGFIANPSQMMVLVLVPQDDIDPVRTRHSVAYLRFATARGDTVRGEIKRITPAAQDELPSQVMSTEGGGPFAPDPHGQNGLTAYQRFYRVEVAVPGLGAHPVEERVYALFRHDWEPLGFRLYRGLRQLLLSRLDV